MKIFFGGRAIYDMGMRSDFEVSRVIASETWAFPNAATYQLVKVCQLIQENVSPSMIHKDEIVWKDSEDGNLKMSSGIISILSQVEWHDMVWFSQW